MGCSSSKLAGDEFNDTEATKPRQTVSKPSTSTMTQQDNAHKETRSPSFGSHAYMGTLPFTGKPNESTQTEDKAPLIEGQSDSVTKYAYEVRNRDVEIARTGGSNSGVSYAPTPSNP